MRVCNLLFPCLILAWQGADGPSKFTGDPLLAYGRLVLAFLLHRPDSNIF